MKHTRKNLLALAALALAMTAPQTRAQSTYTPYAFTNLAGLPGVMGTNDGTGSVARFGSDFGGPGGVAVDSAGVIYVADTGNHTIRKITPAGEVTTFAGSPGKADITDGVGNAARFYEPRGLAVDSAGNVYVANAGHHTIRKITPGRVVTTLAGKPGENGWTDGTGSAARFSCPYDIAVDGAGYLYVVDKCSSIIRKITPGGTVTTLAGSANQRGTNDGPGILARFNNPFAGVAVDSAYNVFVADTMNCTIRKIMPDGEVTTLAGSPGKTGSTDGPASVARFLYPQGLALDSAGNIYVVDRNNYTIRKMTPGGVVTTLAGKVGWNGSADGIGIGARFSAPGAVAVDSMGALYVADWANYRITKGTPLDLRFDLGAGSLTVSNGFFQMRLTGPPGSNVVVESSASLQGWMPIRTNALPAGGTNLSVPLGTNQNQFFRARLAP